MWNRKNPSGTPSPTMRAPALDPTSPERRRQDSFHLHAKEIMRKLLAIMLLLAWPAQAAQVHAHRETDIGFDSVPGNFGEV